MSTGTVAGIDLIEKKKRLVTKMGKKYVARRHDIYQDQAHITIKYTHSTINMIVILIMASLCSLTTTDLHADVFDEMISSNFLPRAVGGESAAARPSSAPDVGHQPLAVVVRGGEIGGVLPSFRVTTFRHGVIHLKTLRNS